MSNQMYVHGVCKYHGKLEPIEAMLKKWELGHLLRASQEGEFNLNGVYACNGSESNGYRKEDSLIACLREIAKKVKIEPVEFRCHGPGSDNVCDIIHAGGNFIVVPLELQPTLEALDDPAVRDHYGYDYCVSEP
ncbi:MAG: hypothetical protein KC978_16925 [Candidatus Omnitrophica bacterium]|nr:hypothetical protein [Candidatus Omnitrophota bacterium]